LDRNLERDSLVELEERTAVEAHEGLPHQREFDRQNVARLARWIVARRAVDLVDMAIGQQGHIELRGFLGRAVEPKPGGYLGHRFSPLVVCVRGPTGRGD